MANLASAINAARGAAITASQALSGRGPAAPQAAGQGAAQAPAPRGILARAVGAVTSTAVRAGAAVTGAAAGAAGAVTGAAGAVAGAAPAQGTASAAASLQQTLDTFSIQELMKLLTLILPYFVVFLFIMMSIINSNIKGFAYFFGLVIIYFVVRLFQGSLPKNQERICAVFDSFHYVHPSFISALYAYTIVYMIIPMATYNVFNIPLIIILLIFSVIDGIVRFKYGCTNIKAVALGAVLGAGAATIWFFMLQGSGNSSLLFYDDLVSNKQSCSRKNNEQFKCSVYKNGELLNTLSSNTNLASS
jgi:hypothetical protein